MKMNTVGGVGRLAVVGTSNPKLEQMVRVRAEATQYLKQYGQPSLYEQGWRFEFHQKKQALGTCYYDRKVIAFSVYYLESDPEQVTDTLLHEVAHALAGAKAGHGAVWKMQALAIGCDATRTSTAYRTTSTAKYNYFMECPTCKRRWYRHRMRRRNHGSTCPDDGTQVKIYKIVRSN